MQSTRSGTQRKTSLRTPRTGSAALAALERLHRSYGGEYSVAKRALLKQLDRARLKSTREVRRLHELLCWLRAYPDNAALLAEVERMLLRFERRPDLRRHRAALADSGIAGTDIHYAFFWNTACWLAERWPDRLALDWEAQDDWTALGQALPALAPYAGGPSFRELQRVDELTTRESLRCLLDPGVTDAACVLQRLRELPGTEVTREALHDLLSLYYVLRAGSGTPSRTRAKHPRSPVVHRTSAPTAERPDLASAMRRPPRAVQTVSLREGRALIDLAQEAMVTRQRDLEAFACGDPRDVRIVDDGDGLQFACIGVVPERRLLLPAVYAFLTLRNGVPIGYIQADVLFQSAEIAYNTFETFRGGEAAHVFGRLLAACRHLFAARSFSVEPYQLGHANEEGLASGAWWFYYKLGFRPHDRDVRRLVRREVERVRRRPQHRSDAATLQRLARRHLYWGPPHDGLPPGLPRHQHVGPQSARIVAERFGADLASSLRAASVEAGRLLGVRSLRGSSAHERLAWERWAPIVLALDGLPDWSRGERHGLIEVIRAKGGRRESDFVARFDAHRRLRRAVAALISRTELIRRRTRAARS